MGKRIMPGRPPDKALLVSCIPFQPDVAECCEKGSFPLDHFSECSKLKEKEARRESLVASLQLF